MVEQEASNGYRVTGLLVNVRVYTLHVPYQDFNGVSDGSGMFVGRD